MKIYSHSALMGRGDNLASDGRLAALQLNNSNISGCLDWLGRE